MRARFIIGSVLVTGVILSSLGCSPLSGVQMGVKLVGNAVDHEDVKKRQEQLIGQSPGSADSILGQREDTLREVGGSRKWLVYPVEMDVLHQYRYVVEVENGRITAVTKAQKNAKKLDIPEQLIYEQKTKGKSPSECDEILDFGPPKLTARSESTGTLLRLYDAQKIKIDGVLAPHYALLKFDDNDRCEDIELISVSASTKQDSLNL